MPPINSYGIFCLLDSNDMYELKKTLFVWLPLSLIAYGCASLLSSDLPNVPLSVNSQSHNIAIPAQTQQGSTYANQLYKGY